MTRVMIQSRWESYSPLHLDRELIPSPSFFFYKGLLKTDPHQSGNHLEIPKRKGLRTNVITGIVFIKYDMIGNSWGKLLPMKEGVSKDVTD